MGRAEPAQIGIGPKGGKDLHEDHGRLALCALGLSEYELVQVVDRLVETDGGGQQLAIDA